MTKAWRNNTPALRSWKLRNFKSVVDANIDLAPLTLVVGANSAGKSSLLQSILAMAQASLEETPGGFPLNGPLVGLGAFEEVRTDFTPRIGTSIEIGGQVALPSFFRQYSAYSSQIYRMGLLLERNSDTPESADKWDWNVCLTRDPDSNGAIVNESRVELSQAGRQLGYLSATHREMDDKAPPMPVIQEGRYGNGYAMHQKLDSEFEDGVQLRRNRRSVKAKTLDFGSAVFKSGVPVDGLCIMTEAEYFLTRLDEMALDIRREPSFIRPEPDSSAKRRSSSVEDAARKLYVHLKDPFGNFVETFRRDRKIDLESVSDQAATAYGNVLRQGNDYAQKVWLSLGQLLSESVSEVRVMQAQVQDDDMRDIAAFVPHYFSDQILYLGPLREDPRVTYPHSIAGSTHMPLGRKGESTASVLLQNQSSGRRMGKMGNERYPLPTGSNTQSLWESVRSWARTFGLGETLRVSDENRYGVSFKIDTRDLTSVGTGVSQLLPVIVICLMSRPGQIVLLEQPELHLNPALQQHLADFFLAIIKTGRQLIVETHSEYIITRLRRRVAEDATDEIRRLFNIVFAERDKAGRTTFRVFDVDSSGALGVDEWPEGFFDQAGQDVEAMMRQVHARSRGGNYK